MTSRFREMVKNATLGYQEDRLSASTCLSDTKYLCVVRRSVLGVEY